MPSLIFVNTQTIPFFNGINTGMKSARSFQFGVFPRTEIPVFIKSYRDYCNMIDKYMKIARNRRH